MKKLNILITATSLILISVTHSSQAATDSATQKQVETLFRLTQMEKKIDESVESVLQLQLRQNPQLSKHQSEVKAFFEKHIGWNAMKGDITNMYMQTFSEDELKAINDFYITPAGQKVITALPQLVQQRNQLAMQRLQKNVGELKKIIEKPVKQ